MVSGQIFRGQFAERDLLGVDPSNELVEPKVSDFRPCFFVRHGSGTDGSAALPAFRIVKAEQS